MKKIILLAFIFVSVVSCKTNDVKPKDISAVKSLAYIHVAYGTEFSAISFPTTIKVVYSDNTTAEIPVSFSAGSYSGTVAGTYEIEGTLTPANGTTNSMGLSAIAHVVVSQVKLTAITQDDVPLSEYFYDTLNRLDHFHVDASNTDYYYTYASVSDNKVTQRVRKLAGSNYPEKYYYTGSALDKIEFYYGDNVLGQTHTYTTISGKITRYDNSDQTIAGLKFRTFEYSPNNDVSKVSFDVGNSWNYTYVGDKKVATPLVLDLADPQNQEARPIATFEFVTLSSYNSAYTYNAWGYPTQEVRTYPGNGNSTSTLTYTYE